MVSSSMDEEPIEDARGLIKALYCRFQYPPHGGPAANCRSVHGAGQLGPPFSTDLVVVTTIGPRIPSDTNCKKTVPIDGDQNRQPMARLWGNLFGTLIRHSSIIVGFGSGPE